MDKNGRKRMVKIAVQHCRVDRQPKWRATAKLTASANWNLTSGPWGLGGPPAGGGRGGGVLSNNKTKLNLS